MTLRLRLENQLKLIREVSEKLLAAFHTPQQWTYQVHEQANHALWFAGHIGTVDNFMIARFDPQKVKEPKGFLNKFSMGSRPSPNPADYPPAEAVLAFMRERRAALLSILAGLSEEDLLKPSPPGTPPFMPDLASIFEATVWHEALHAGQVTVARRALGHPPMADAPPKSEAVAGQSISAQTAAQAQQATGL
jgi:uncharacterized damage-inducible protein DinB